MIIKSLELENFRNYKNLHLYFDEGTNILTGENAQGKTNILEALYICSTTKSHKGSKDSEIINFNSDESHIKTIIDKNDEDVVIDFHLRKNKSKVIALNHEKLLKGTGNQNNNGSGSPWGMAESSFTGSTSNADRMKEVILNRNRDQHK